LPQKKSFIVFIFFFSFLPLITINKADYSGFYYYVKAILKHLTICLMAGNMFLMVTFDKILSICYSNSNQTAKHILQWCGWDCSQLSYQKKGCYSLSQKKNSRCGSFLFKQHIFWMRNMDLKCDLIRCYTNG